MPSTDKKTFGQQMRALHRDIGFVVAGLTMLFALSGMAQIFRDTDLLQHEITTPVQLEPRLAVEALAPALKMREQKHISRAILFGGGLFLSGVIFCYFILMPIALAASQKYSQWLGFGAMQWKAEDYISFVCKFLLGMGLGFELPVVLLTLVKLGVLSYTTLRKMWRYMIVIVLVLGGLLTTPEVVTQVMMAGPLYLLYEISVWIAWYWEWRDRKRAARANAT